jgi:hypothetical protein
LSRKDTSEEKNKPPAATYVNLKGSERHPSPGAKLIGPADPKEQFRVTIVLRRRPDGQPMPTPDYYARVPPAKRRRLSEAEFAAKYGASPEDIQAVTNYATAMGLTIVETSAARRSVIVSGTVAQMEKAFKVTLNQYEAPVSLSGSKPPMKGTEPPAMEVYRGRDGFIQVPKELTDIVIGAFGLDNRKITKRNGAGDPANTTYLTLPQVTGTFYDFPNNSAAGQTIAILSEGGYDTSTGPSNDITKYFASLPAGFAAPAILTVPAAASVDNGNPDDETTQDICTAATVAQGATIAVYFLLYFEVGQNAWHDLIERVITPNTGDFPAGVNPPSVLSSSFYVSDGDDAGTLSNEGITSAFVNAIHLAFEDAAVQGVTVCIAAGDQGSDSKVGSATGVTEWGETFAADNNAHVQYPASDPLVLSCGGTTIGNVNGSSFEEYVWNDTYPTSLGITVINWATAGGVSDYFTEAAGYATSYSYQQNANIPKSVNDNHVGRGVPDVSGNASLNAGYPYFYGGGSSWFQVSWWMNGTSVVAPMYAGLIAVINAALNERVGFLNPTLYALGNSVCRDINAPPGPTNNGLNGIKGYTAGPGWDACTGWGVIDGNLLLDALQILYRKSVSFVTDRSTYGQDEIDALRTQPGGAVVTSAFFVIVDGFTPNELGITGTSSLSAAPVVTLSPSTGVTNPAACTSLESDDPSFGPEVQRFRFGYDVNFGSDDSAFTAFAGDSELVTLSTVFQGISASAQVQLIKQPDPYILQGPQTWWLSNDLRLIQVAEGETAFGVMMGTDPFAFLSSVTTALEAGQGTAGLQSFDTNTQEDSETLTVAPTNSAGRNVYNFAIARVHYQALVSKAQHVRVFFRLFAANSTNTDFQPDATYRRYAAYSPAYPVPSANYFQDVLPELGVAAGEYVTIPCFGEARVDPAQAGAPNTLPSLQTPDGTNVKDLSATAGPLHDTFYGSWLDINQTTPALPSSPPSGNTDGPWPGLTLEPVQQAFIANEHTCIVAEIAFDPVAVSAGTAPFNSDKLAQRNISWSYVANPGVEASRLAIEPFEFRPTPTSSVNNEAPDELMIDWNSVPVGQTAQIYLPAVDAGAVVAQAAELYTAEHLSYVDAHTVGCTTGGVTYIPIPKGSGTGANFTGLLSVSLPYGIKKGQKFEVLVRQLTSVGGRGKPEVAQSKATDTAMVPTISWRRVLGTFQIDIPVTTKEILLPREERRLSIFRWIGESMPPQRRWYPVFQRYLQAIADKVQALGGDPTRIFPSPTGEWLDERRGKPPVSEKHGEELTGKVSALIFDHFGDFEGFILETEEKEHKFNSRERHVEELVDRIWRERLRVTVWVDHDEPNRPLKIVVREPPATFGL